MNPLLCLNFRKRIDFETIEIRKWDRRIVSCFFLSFPTANRKWQDRESIWREELNEWFVSEGEEEQFDRFTWLFLSFKTIHWIFSLLSTISRGYFDLKKIFFLDVSCLFLKLRIEDNSLPFSSRRCGFSVCLQEIDSRKTIISKIGGRREIWFLFFFFFLRFACAKSFGKWFFERENGEGGRGEAREIGGERWYLTGKIEFSNLRWIENIYNIYF